MSTYTPKRGDIQRAWHVVDADGLILGRLASEVAKILRGKHKPIFTPHQDTGDHVVIVNADKVVLSGSKRADKAVYSHSGYPGGLKTKSYGDLLAEKPEEALRITIGGMLPKNRLGRQMLTKLKIYSGGDHPHEAQKPQPLELEHTRLRGPQEKKSIEAKLDDSEHVESSKEKVEQEFCCKDDMSDCSCDEPFIIEGINDFERKTEITGMGGRGGPVDSVRSRHNEIEKQNEAYNKMIRESEDVIDNIDTIPTNEPLEENDPNIHKK